MRTRPLIISATMIFVLVLAVAVVAQAADPFVGTWKLLRTTKSTANKAVSGIVDSGIPVETTGRRRDRAYSYEGYLNLLRAGTELA